MTDEFTLDMTSNLSACNYEASGDRFLASALWHRNTPDAYHYAIGYRWFITLELGTQNHYTNMTTKNECFRQSPIFAEPCNPQRFMGLTFPKAAVRIEPISEFDPQRLVGPQTPTRFRSALELHQNDQRWCELQWTGATVGGDPSLTGAATLPRPTRLLSNGTINAFDVNGSIVYDIREPGDIQEHTFAVRGNIGFEDLAACIPER